MAKPPLELHERRLKRDASKRQIPKGTRYGMTKGASPHTIWIRDDLWVAARAYASREQLTIRAVVEKAIWDFIWRDTQSQMDGTHPTSERPAEFKRE